MVKTPILFETFARPEYAIPAFEQIKKAKPHKLYFYSNKARSDRPDEIERNERIRALVKQVDWDCDVYCYFREEYVDIYTSLQGAMDWVFDNEDRAIILEEDCLASLPFFEFCEHFLDKYEDKPEIAFITGDNYLDNYDTKGADHIINRTFYMFGWATWKNRWKSINHDIRVDQFLSERYIEDYYDDKRMAKFWNCFYKKHSSFIDKTHCWDYIFCMNCMMKGFFGVSPVVNLVTNVGTYGEHSKGESGSNSYKYVYTGHFYPFNCSDVYVGPDMVYDKLMFEKYYGPMMTIGYKLRNDSIPFIISLARKIMGRNLYDKSKKILKSFL